MFKRIKKAPSLCLFGLMAVMILVSLISCTDQKIISFGLEARDLVVSRERGGEKASPPVFKAGEQFYMQFEISEYDLDEAGNAWIQEDLTMISGDGKIILNESNIIDEKVKPPEGTEWWRVTNKITLPEVVEPGKVTIEINVRDKIGGGTLYIRKTIEVEKE
ncbi:MAG: hypothetical protein JW984_00880 [Deltaproteobacteria bacterium]|uniref:Uncharacterized protein n=1 Tax=Candidatus Zymogenus saltonus TaxID=2844893 RepID=A0A9D8KBC4_9DELT|nr:hypothetical protein [Candidatus Zymogenus saltonus]